MKAIRRIVLYIVFLSALFAAMDFTPIHLSYLKYGHFPDKSVDTWWPSWSAFRYDAAMIFCPICAGFAEHLYFVPFELLTSENEKQDLLLKHTPPGSYEGILSPSGFWWGQGGPDNSNPWKRISLLDFWMYWIPPAVIWFILFGELFWLRWPWWLRVFARQTNPHILKKVL